MSKKWVVVSGEMFEQLKKSHENENSMHTTPQAENAHQEMAEEVVGKEANLDVSGKQPNRSGDVDHGEPNIDVSDKQPLRPGDVDHPPTREEVAAAREAAVVPLAAPAEVEAGNQLESDKPASDVAAKENRDLGGLPENVWLEQLPANYRQSAMRFLRNITHNEGFNVDKDGTISIDGETVPDYDIVKFLRYHCVPFSKGKRPARLTDWMKKHNIVKFRNHLAAVRPPWINKFGSKKRTMAKAQGL